MSARVLVTGGGGAVGSAVVRALRDRGVAVRSFSRSAHPHLDALGVETVRGDLADLTAVEGAVDGCDAVVHAAAKADMTLDPRPFIATNVVGTANVIAACRRRGVGRLVFTSTPSVVHAGRSIAGADESLPYPAHHEAPYPATKARAERLVLAANGDGLATVALRPHLVWGPGDTQLTARVIARARAGRLRLIDHGRAVVDATYIDDAAAAHVCALDALEVEASPAFHRPADRSHPSDPHRSADPETAVDAHRSADPETEVDPYRPAGPSPVPDPDRQPGPDRQPVAGRAFFVASGRPRPIAEMVNGLLTAAGLPPEERSVPLGVALAAGAACEALWRATRRTTEPPITRFLARQQATDHWFDLTAARRDLGYTPAVDPDEGFRRLAAALR